MIDGFWTPVVERVLMIYPLRAGRLTIPPFTRRIAYRIEESGGRRRSFPPRLSRSRRARGTDSCRRARRLSAGQQPAHLDAWDPEPDKIPFGETARRTVTVEAEGVTADRLPPLPNFRAPGVITFAAPVERQDDRHRSGADRARRLSLERAAGVVDRGLRAADPHRLVRRRDAADARGGRARAPRRLRRGARASGPRRAAREPWPAGAATADRHFGELRRDGGSRLSSRRRIIRATSRARAGGARGVAPRRPRRRRRRLSSRGEPIGAGRSRGLAGGRRARGHWRAARRARRFSLWAGRGREPPRRSRRSRARHRRRRGRRAALDSGQNMETALTG